MKKMLKFYIEVFSADYFRHETIRFYQIGEKEWAYNRRSNTTYGEDEKDGVIHFSPFKYMKHMTDAYKICYKNCKVTCVEKSF